MGKKPEYKLPLSGAVATGFLASAGCIGPLIVAALGLGSASAFLVLEPWRPIFAALTLALLGWAGWRHWQAQKACVADGCPPARPVLLWILGALSLTLLFAPRLIALLSAPAAT